MRYISCLLARSLLVLKILKRSLLVLKNTKKIQLIHQYYVKNDKNDKTCIKISKNTKKNMEIGTVIVQPEKVNDKYILKLDMWQLEDIRKALVRVNKQREYSNNWVEKDPESP